MATIIAGMHEFDGVGEHESALNLPALVQG